MINKKILSKIIIAFNIAFLLPCFLPVAFAANDPIVATTQYQKINYGTVPVVILSGSRHQMGLQYGQALKVELQSALDILEDYYITQKGLSYTQLAQQAQIFYNRFPLSYQLFLQGIAQGSGLPLSDVKILNAMETLGELLPSNQDVKCAFMFVPPAKTTTYAALIGRNYDYSPPFDKLAKYLVVTILNEPNTIPTAFISIAGEVYCPSCINAKGLFMELNNGMPSGGFTVNHDRQSLLINMLVALQNSTSLAQIETQMNATQADYSLIVNAADADYAKSFEFSSTLGMKFFNTDPTATFVSTNFYLDPAWGNVIPKPTDLSTWLGVTRRNNLLNLSDQTPVYNLILFKKTMNTKIINGGAMSTHTIYQLIFDEYDMTLYIKINSQGKAWQEIPLGDIFSRVNPS